MFQRFPGTWAEGGSFSSKRKFKDHPVRRRTFDRAFEQFTMRGAEVTELFAECGSTL